MKTTSLKNAIVDYVARDSWDRLKETCRRVGLTPAPDEQQGGRKSKQDYIWARLEATPAEHHLDIAIRLCNEKQDQALRRAIVPHLSKEIKPEIRRKIIEELAHLQSIRGQKLQGTLSANDFLCRIGCEPPLDVILSSLYGTGREPSTDVTTHLSVLLEETDDSFLGFLRLVLHPTTRFQRGQQTQNLLFLGELVEMVNKHLPAAGFEIRKTGTIGSEPLFEPVVIRVNIEEVRCLIFAAAEEKPNIAIADVLSLDVEVRRRVASKYLVYQTPIAPEGMRWGDLTGWWAELAETPSSDVVARSFYTRLFSGLQSEPECNLFYAYCKRFPITNKAWPALIPQFYLRWDPDSGRQVRKPQRYDFLLLLPKGARAVVEVDGIQHYAVKNDGGPWQPSPNAYAKTVADTRELNLMGYQVYRFAASELQIREAAERIVGDFFPKLFECHSVQG